MKRRMGGKPRICIVGSGVGGSIAAMELAQSGAAAVIMVDTDRIGENYSQAHERKLEGVCAGAPFSQDVTRVFGYGGGSNLWHGVFTTLDPEDWRFIDAAAGDVISAQIQPLYRELGRWFGEVPVESKSPGRSKSRGNAFYRDLEDTGLFVSKDFFIQKRPFRAREALRKLKIDCPDLKFVENATALYLTEHSEEASRAASLAVNVGGEKQFIEAEFFILAAGALETPRIVLQGSDEGHFRVKNDHVGKYLIDHPWTVVGEIVSRKGWFRLGLSDVYSSPGLRYRIGYRMRESVDNPSLGTNHCIAFKPVFFGEYELFKGAMKTIISRKPSLASLLGLLRQASVTDILASVLLLICEKFALGVFVRRALVFCYLDQPGRMESAVLLTEGRDPLGRRIPSINWALGREEAAGVALVRSALGRAFSDSPAYSFLPYPDPAGGLASGAHHAGTMRIGCDGGGVVDKNLKIHGTDNVYVCDSSVFPNFGNSNPTLTLAAFSLRLARRVLFEIRVRGA